MKADKEDEASKLVKLTEVEGTGSILDELMICVDEVTMTLDVPI